MSLHDHDLNPGAIDDQGIYDFTDIQSLAQASYDNQSYAPPVDPVDTDDDSPVKGGLLEQAINESNTESTRTKGIQDYFQSMFLSSNIPVAIKGLHNVIAVMRKDPEELDHYLNGQVAGWDIVELYVKELQVMLAQLNKSVGLTQEQRERLLFILGMSALLSGMSEERAEALAQSAK